MDCVSGAIDYYTNYDALLTLPGLLTQVEGVAGTSIDFYLHSFDSWTSTYPSSGDSDIYDRLTNGIYLFLIVPCPQYKIYFCKLSYRLNTRDDP